MKKQKASIRKANDLRKDNVAAGKICEKTVDDWEKAIKSAKTREERKRVDKVFNKLSAKHEKMESSTYKKYYNYVHKNFDKSAIDRARKTKTGKIVDFMSKEFISRLVKESKKK